MGHLYSLSMISQSHHPSSSGEGSYSILYPWEQSETNELHCVRLNTLEVGCGNNDVISQLHALLLDFFFLVLLLLFLHYYWIPSIQVFKVNIFVFIYTTLSNWSSEQFAATIEEKSWQNSSINNAENWAWKLIVYEYSYLAEHSTICVILKYICNMAYSLHVVFTHTICSIVGCIHGTWLWVWH